MSRFLSLQKEKTMKRLGLNYVLTLLVCGLTLLVNVADATIISVAGNAQNPAIPANLSEGQFESDLVSGFNESQDVNIAANTIFVDYLITNADVGNQFTGLTVPNNVLLSAGTYDSHLLHFDPVGNSGNVSNATFTFDGNIVAIIADGSLLNNSDATFGVDGTTYETELDRRAGTADTFTITSLNSLRIDSFDVPGGNNIDELRVITTIPELVDIDIKPGSDPNCFNNDGNGVIPVAILGSASFDVTQVDAATVQLEGMAVKAVGKSNKLLASIEDVNSDLFDDLVVKIEDTDGVFSAGDATAIVSGNLLPAFGSTAFQGTDTICIVGPAAPRLNSQSKLTTTWASMKAKR